VESTIDEDRVGITWNGQGRNSPQHNFVLAGR
jgi:hypothetical protein